MDRENYYRGDATHPYHLSVGALVMDKEGLIACHHYDELAYWNLPKGSGGCYVLMRETLEIGETIEQALHRGAMEEFGMTIRVISFLGSIVASFKKNEIGPDIEKTTLYFWVEPLTFESSRRQDNPENMSTIEWKSAEFLLTEMPEQALRLKRDDIDEAQIIERALLYRRQHP